MTTILLVENEDSLRALLVEILQRSGYAVHAVGTGPAALEFCGLYQDTIDVLITELVMGPISGIQLSTTLLWRYPGMRIIITSAHGVETLAPHVPAPKHIFMPKPFSGALLVDRLLEVSPDREPVAVESRE